MTALITKRYLWWLVAIGLVAVVSLAATSRVSAEGPYVVRQGDNLYRLSQQFGVTVGDLVRANGLRSADFIREGQELVIPNQPGNVQGGGTPRAQTPEEALVDDPAAVAAPASEPESAHAIAAADQNLSERYHQVEPGDTLWGIARAYSVSVRDVQAANGLSNADYIRTGQILTIPAAGYVAPVQARPTAVAPPPPPAQAGYDNAPWLTADFSKSPAFRLTHYCLPGQMASGRIVYPGAVAADASIFPLGTRLLIEGLIGIFTVEDRFGWDAREFRLDLWVGSCAEAVQRGVQTRRVLRVVTE